MFTKIKVFLFVALFPIIAICQPTNKYLIKAGKFFDSEKKTFVSNQFIFIEGEKVIKVINANRQIYKGYTIIDLSKATVIPGLIDAHTHFLFMQKMGGKMEQDIIDYSDEERLLRGAGIAKSFLVAGITSVRDLGNSGQYLDITLKKAIDKGWVQGSRMFISGPIICPPGGQFGKMDEQHKDIPAKEYSIVNNVEEAKNATLQHIAKAVDVIKICATNDHGKNLSVEQMKIIVETAHASGIKVTAHATFDNVIKDAVNAGVDGIEHGYYLTDSTLKLMAQKNIYLVPTDGTFEGYKAIALAGDWKATDKEIRSMVAAGVKRVQRAVKFGVKIFFGSDLYLYTARPIGMEAKNTLVSYFEAGIPVNEVLQIGTLNPAIVLGKKDQLGVIKAGAFADIVAFEGDLEKNFKELIYEKVTFVMKAGIIIK